MLEWVIGPLQFTIRKANMDTLYVLGAFETNPVSRKARDRAQLKTQQKLKTQQTLQSASKY
jgi:hypothetical protein